MQLTSKNKTLKASCHSKLPLACVNSGGPDHCDVPPDVEMVLEQGHDPGLQGLAGFRMLGHDAVQDQVVLLVLLEFVHFFLKHRIRYLLGSLYRLGLLKLGLVRLDLGSVEKQLIAKEEVSSS